MPLYSQIIKTSPGVSGSSVGEVSSRVYAAFPSNPLRLGTMGFSSFSVSSCVRICVSERTCQTANIRKENGKDREIHGDPPWM